MFYIDQVSGTKIVSNYPPADKPQVCIFRMCYVVGFRRYQATPQICNYTSGIESSKYATLFVFLHVFFLAEQALSSTMRTVLPTSHSVSSTLTESLEKTHDSRSLTQTQTHQTSFFHQMHTTTHAPSSSPLTSAGM